MVTYRLGQAAKLLGVSVDTVRRHADSGRLPTTRSAGQQRLVDGGRRRRLLSLTGVDLRQQVGVDAHLAWRRGAGCECRGQRAERYCIFHRFFSVP